ncbi:MAG: PilZ domain-containing protein [Deltaproteobacteria bacterium]|nr:PilZ domain-containing protein [Deltaproteobacteria bacterium]
MDSNGQVTVPTELSPRGEAIPRVIERRRFKRVAATLAVTETSDTNFYVGLTEDISEGGIFVATHVAEPIGSLVELTLELGDGAEPIAFKGRVRWLRECEPQGMGVMFEGLSAEHQARIAAFMRSRSPEFFDD